ncbi:MAG: DUF4244 domain-containing protein [Actinomycetia bacterium]|nr:DUF4244 domain-containing protein [Actinomycetes bacterium]MCP4222680.1 DUF4244 domain-containing protein [Actinomycetes bacterium]MCP5032039.1 DUF4244 domain-containing protein [Actinomycetes bacterium]
MDPTTPTRQTSARPAITDSADVRPPSERGQATAEYALVMLAAAALAGLLLAWASSSGGVDRLLNAVMDTLIDQAG